MSLAFQCNKTIAEHLIILLNKNYLHLTEEKECSHSSIYEQPVMHIKAVRKPVPSAMAQQAQTQHTTI